MAATNSNPLDAGDPVTTVDTSNPAPAPSHLSDPKGQQLYPNGSPEPRGILPVQEKESSEQASDDPVTGTGVDGELMIWEARYSTRNFIGRAVMRVVATIAAAFLAYYIWGQGHEDMSKLGWLVIVAVAIYWAALIFRMIQAHYSHYYKLTNRRLFVSTGMLKRRRDMLELLRVKDVFTRQQSILERWMGLGTVVVEPTDKSLPTFYLAGVNDPKEVMDLVWHHARAERDQRSVKVDSV